MVIVYAPQASGVAFIWLQSHIHIILPATAGCPHYRVLKGIVYQRLGQMYLALNALNIHLVNCIQFSPLLSMTE